MKEELLERLRGLDIPDEVVQEWINEWDPIILVDRSIHPQYPDFVDEAKYPELELNGPAEFDVRKLERYLHPKQVDGYVTGNEILAELIAKEMLKWCLGVTDLQAIQARGVGFFRKHFNGKAVFGWKSVILSHDGRLYVPYLYENGDKVVLGWHQLGNYWYSFHPALRHQALRTL